MLVLSPLRLLRSTLGPLELFRFVLTLLAVSFLTVRTCPVGVHQLHGPKGPSSDDEGEDDDSDLRLTVGDAWIFPVVCSFNFALRA